MPRPSLGFAFVLLIAAAQAGAMNHWRHYMPNAVPWVSPQAIVTFDGRLYLSANGARDGSATRLWRSTDGENWTVETIAPGEAIVAHEFVVQDGALFAAAVAPAATGAPERRVYRTTDGSSWIRIDGGLFGAGAWSNAVSYNGHLYVVGLPNKIWRTTGAGPTPAWTSVPAPEHEDTIGQVVIAGFVEEMYAMKISAPNAGARTVSYGATAGGDPAHGWSVSVGLTHMAGAIKWGVVAHREKLYWGNTILKTVQHFTSVRLWSSDLAAGRGNPVPFDVGGRLVVMNPGEPILTRDDAASVWRSARRESLPFCDETFGRFSNTATLGATHFVLPCDLYAIESGVRFATVEAPAAARFPFGARNRPALAVSVGVNFDDVMERFSVRNAGTAEARRDIQRVTLMRTNDASELEFVSELVPTDSRTWETPDLFSYALRDDERFIVAVDVAVNPAPEQTIQMTVAHNGLAFGTAGLIAPAIAGTNAPVAIEENLALNRQINDVLIYPSPARDTVHFAYDLLSPADVSVRVFDRQGILVAEIRDPQKSPALGSVTRWNASAYAPGVYHAAIEISGFEGERRLIRRNVVIER